jgi:hypothetical protein
MLSYQQKGGIGMKRFAKIALAVLSVLSYLCLAFWVMIYFFNGCGYLYFRQEVLKTVAVSGAVLILGLVFLIFMIVKMFRGTETIRKGSFLFQIPLIPLSLFLSFMASCMLTLGPYGCSYTQNIANYGNYDREMDIAHFPESIREDMTLVSFSYFYKYIDTTQTDLYLEVKFDDRQTMEKYLTQAKEAWSENGIQEFQNPYDPGYRDFVENRQLQGFSVSRISFGGDGDYQYVDMDYRSVSYSFDDLTIIYNYTEIGNDIFLGDDPERGEYTPKYLERFGVEKDSANNFRFIPEK